MAGLSRRALCAGLMAMPMAYGMGSITGATGAIARTTVTVPDLVARVVDVVAEHYGVSADDIFVRRKSPVALTARREALFLALSLSPKPDIEVGRRFGITNRTIIMGLMNKTAGEGSRDPAFVDRILELAGRVHPYAPAMLLEEVPPVDLETGRVLPRVYRHIA